MEQLQYLSLLACTVIQNGMVVFKNRILLREISTFLCSKTNRKSWSFFVTRCYNFADQFWEKSDISTLHHGNKKGKWCSSITLSTKNVFVCINREAVNSLTNYLFWCDDLIYIFFSFKQYFSLISLFLESIPSLRYFMIPCVRSKMIKAGRRVSNWKDLIANYFRVILNTQR